MSDPKEKECIICGWPVKDSAWPDFCSLRCRGEHEGERFDEPEEETFEGYEIGR